MMGISWRDLMSGVHGALFGGFFVAAIAAIVVELCRSALSRGDAELTERGHRLAGIYLFVTAALGWAAVLTGAYIVYPWYRAIPPAGVVDLSGYPQRFLLEKAATSGWHTLGMEWKEHVAWFAPIAMTMVAFVLTKYRGVTGQHSQVRRAVVTFTMLALLAAGIAGFFGVMIDKAAPVTGGGTIVLEGGSR